MNKANPKSPQPGLHVHCTIDGKTQMWGTITEVNDDGSLNLNVHDDVGVIVGGHHKFKFAPGMDHSVAKTWWV